MDSLEYGARAVLIGIGLFNVGVSFVVAVRFSLFAHYKTRPGLLPLHVYVVAISYTIFVLLVIIKLTDNQSDGWAYWVGYSVAVILGFVAMCVIALRDETGSQSEHHERKQ